MNIMNCMKGEKGDKCWKYLNCSWGPEGSKCRSVNNNYEIYAPTVNIKNNKSTISNLIRS